MSDDKRGEYLPAALDFLEDFLEISLRHAQWRVRRPVRGDRRVAQAVDHDGGGVLCRDAGGCFGSSRQAGHLQYGQGSQFIGDWSDEEIVTAMTTGKRPDGRMLAPIMPWH